MKDQSKLKSQIQSILLVAGKPVTIGELARALETEESEIKNAAAQIAAANHDSGIILLAHNDKLQFASNPENSSAVKKFLSLELREKLTDAAIETLAIIAYRQPISKAEIENVRGVNSQYIIRQLMIRGLIEKTGSSSDKRIQLYKTTLEFMQHLGLKSNDELPDFDKLTAHIQLPSPDQNNS